MAQYENKTEKRHKNHREQDVKTQTSEKECGIKNKELINERGEIK